MRSSPAILVLVLVTFGIALSTPSAFASAGAGQACDVQSGNCYSSIQAAINAASPGDTINIGTGAFTEHLAVDRSLNLQGSTTAGTIIDGSMAANQTVVTVSSGTTVTVTAVTIENGSNSFGGGIDNNGTLTLNDDTISGNTASDGGGGIYNAGGGLTLNNDTLSGNTAAAAGGAIENDSGGSLNLTNVTISANTAGNGSGLFQNSGRFVIKNSILAANKSSSSAGCGSGLVYDLGYNVLDSNPSSGGCTNLGGSATDQNVADPKLGTLANNGGPTDTMALLSGSPAIGNGNATFCENLVGPDGRTSDEDQRGDARNSASRTRCDGGAYDTGSNPTAAWTTHIAIKRRGAAVVFHWQMAVWHNVAGFNLYAGTHRLNRHLIDAHRGHSYHYRVHWIGSGPYTLGILLFSGQTLTVTAR